MIKYHIVRFLIFTKSKIMGLHALISKCRVPDQGLRMYSCL